MNVAVEAHRHQRSSSRAGRAGIFVVLVAGALALGGCASIAHAIANKVESHLLHKNAALSSLTTKVQTGSTAPHEVTYVTTGSSPTTITYAAVPPHEFAFDGTENGGGLRIIQNAAGDFACTSSSAATGSGAGAAKWSCLKLVGQEADTYHAMYALYTGAYWIDFLKVYSTVAGLSGVKITSKTIAVNGFALQCVVINGGKTNPGTSTWCVTAQGILGYVSVSNGGTAFEIKSFSPSPPSSLFALPAGATITTLPTSVPTTSS